MRAQQLSRPGPVGEEGPLEPADLPDTRPEPGELRLEVVACAVCRTDLQLATGDLDARRLPIVPGHQAVGRVVERGPGVTGWEVGDRAGVAWLAGSCGECEACCSGKENLCRKAEFTGWDRDGGFADRMTVRADFALRLPDGLPDVAAAPLLCGGVIGYRSLKLSGIEPGGRLGLYGFGASALLAIQVARYWDCEVYVATRSVAEQQRARDMGAAWAGGYDEVPPEPLQAAITFAPAGWVVVKALEALDRGATVAVNAIHLDEIPGFPYDLLWWERQLRSVANFTRADAVEFLELAAAIPLTTMADPYPLSEANRALAALDSGRVAGAAVLTM